MKLASHGMTYSKRINPLARSLLEDVLMRMVSVFCTLILAGSVWSAEPNNERIRELFRSKNYTASWDTAPTYKLDSELEIGDGYGHGGSLGWLRFHPNHDKVNVLSIQFDGGWHSYKSKWPPDKAPLTIKLAAMKADAYAHLLRDLAMVDSARLTSVKRNGDSFSTADFWVYARLTTDKKSYFEFHWAGYESSSKEREYAKPKAAVRIAREAVRQLDFKDHALTAEERTWASSKFVRDWQTFHGLASYWWVRERYLQTVGVVGDKSVFPVMRRILATEPKQGGTRESSDGRCVYLAINAVTRLTKTDVRDQPVEEMDVEKVRLKVLDLIKEQD